MARRAAAAATVLALAGDRCGRARDDDRVRAADSRIARPRAVLPVRPDRRRVCDGMSRRRAAAGAAVSPRARGAVTDEPLWWDCLVVTLVLVPTYLRWRVRRPPPRPLARRVAIYMTTFIALGWVILPRRHLDPTQM